MTNKWTKISNIAKSITAVTAIALLVKINHIIFIVWFLSLCVFIFADIMFVSNKY